MPFDLQDMLVRKRDLAIEYYGQTVNASYLVEKITKEFRADMVRLMRMSNRLTERRKEVMARVQEPNLMVDEETERADTEAVLVGIQQDDDKLKRQIDQAIADVLAEWDVTNKGEPYPPTAENLFAIDAALEGAIVAAILTDTTPLGEANGQQNMRLLPSTSKQRGRQVNSRRHRTG